MRSAKTTIISEGYLSHDLQRTQIITVASPIFDATGSLQKLFAASISNATLRDKVFQALREGIDIQDETVFYLVDRHGHVVASSSSAGGYEPRQTMIRSIGSTNGKPICGYWR